MKITVLPLLLLALIAAALFFAPLTLPLPAYASDRPPPPTRQFSIRSSPAVTSTYYFPLVFRQGITPCSAISGQSYGSVARFSDATNPPAALHPDLNLALRGYISTSAYLGLVSYGGPPSDPSAPQLATLFSPQRLPTFSSAYQVGSWDWPPGCNCQNGWIPYPDVTLLGMSSTMGEIIRTPLSGYDIGLKPTGYEVMVLYATTQRVTLKYTREDNVVSGYTIHIENVCVEPTLLALYNSLNASGRTQLPALNAGQPLGRSWGNQILVSIRDNGTFLDPRSHLDWWDGY